MTTVGEPGPNLHAAASVAADLLLAGCNPVVPHVTWILHAIRPDVPVEAWTDWCLSVLARCDALYRLDGESVGADRELERAKELGIPVFRSIDGIGLWWGAFASRSISGPVQCDDGVSR